MLPKSSQDASKTAFRPPKMAPRRLQNRPRCLQDDPNSAQLLKMPPRSPQDLDFGHSKPRFWTLHASLFEPPNLNFKAPRGRLQPMLLAMEISGAIMSFTSFTRESKYIYSCCYCRRSPTHATAISQGGGIGRKAS